MDKRKRTIHNPLDALAVVPDLLGFRPTDSLVMMVVAGPRQFTARVDLVTNSMYSVDPLVAAAIQHEVTHVVLVVYAGDPTPAEWMHKAKQAYEDAGIGVAMFIHSTHERYCTLDDLTMQQYSLSEHPFTLDRAVNDQTVHESREDLAEMVAGKTGWLLHPPTPQEPADAALFVTSVLLTDQEVSDLDVSRFASYMDDERLRAVATSTFGQAYDTEALSPAVDRLLALLPRVPSTQETAQMISVAAFGAYMRGNGALAWVCLDRVYGETDLAGIVTTCLEQAVPPSVMAGIVHQLLA